MRTEYWLFAFAAIQAVGAAVGIANFFGITAQSVTGWRLSVNSPSYLSLILGVLLILGAIVSGVGWYKMSRTDQTYQHLAASEMEQVHGKQFLNESVELDDKNFVNCTFSGVRLVYQAKKELAMTNNNFIGPIVIHTDNPQAQAAIDLVGNMLRESGFVNKKEVGFFRGKDLVLQKIEQPSPTLQTQ